MFSFILCIYNKTPIFVSVSISAGIFICIHACICSYVDTCVYIHIHIHTHTYQYAGVPDKAPSPRLKTLVDMCSETLQSEALCIHLPAQRHLASTQWVAATSTGLSRCQVSTDA